MFQYEKELELLVQNMPDIIKKHINDNRDKSYKEDGSIYTKTDLEMEKAIIELIKNKYPNDFILSEETMQETNLSDRTWIIDPIDGTTNYSNNLDDFIIQIAFYDANNLQLSYMYFPKEKTYYTAKNGFGAFKNNEQIFVSATTNLKSELVTITNLKDKNKLSTKALNILENMTNKSLKVRIIGSIGVEFIYLATGKTIIMQSNVKNIWDLAPGYLLCKEAGAIITNQNNNDYKFGDESIWLYANKEIYNKFNNQ